MVKFEIRFFRLKLSVYDKPTYLLLNYNKRVSIGLTNEHVDSGIS